MNNHFITKIFIEKLRHLENIEIDLSNTECKHLLLTGKNGVGKTTTLEEIKSWLRIIENPNLNFKVIENFRKEIDKFENQLKVETDKDKVMKLKNEIDRYITCIKDNSSLSLDINFSKDVETIDGAYSQGQYILAFYGANRENRVQLLNGIEKVTLQDKYSLYDNPSYIFIKYLVDLKTQQSFARNEGDMVVVENIESWFNRFENALRAILDDESIRLKFDYRNYDFKLIQDGREPYGLNELSSGYSSIINIVSDLILRMDKNRASKERNYAFDTEGIVLIDEIETHLHIELQKKILPFLTSFFPNIQFVVSTHSPFVLNSIDNAVIYDLEKKVRVDNLSEFLQDDGVKIRF